LVVGLTDPEVELATNDDPELLLRVMVRNDPVRRRRFAEAQLHHLAVEIRRGTRTIVVEQARQK
jgi:hypothetical protein